MLCLMTLADVDAVSARDADAVEGGAAVAPLRRHLQPADAGLRRRGDRARARRRSRRCRRSRPADLDRGGAAALPRRVSAALPGAVRRRRPSTATSGSRATSSPTRCTASSSRRATAWELDGRHARQAVPVLEHLRRALVLRHGHPARQRDDRARGTGARHLPVHRPRGILRAQPEGARAVRDRRCADVVAGRQDVTALLSAQGAQRCCTGRGPRRVDAGRALRQRALAALHRARDRGAGRAGAAAPHQPGHLAPRLRRRSGADLDGRRQGDRRLPPHRRRQPSCRRPPRRRSRRISKRMLEEETMKLIKAIVRPNKVDDIKDALGEAQHLGHDRDRGAGPRPAEGPHRDLSRQGVRGEPAAEDGDRGGGARRAWWTRRSRPSSAPRGPARSATAACSSCRSSRATTSAPARRISSSERSWRYTPAVFSAPRRAAAGAEAALRAREWHRTLRWTREVRHDG